MEWNFPDFILDKNFLTTTHTHVNPTCVCCLAKDVQFIYLKTCVHSTLLTLFGNMLKYEDLVCMKCHRMLKNFHLFKLQVEENIKLLNQQIRTEDISNTKKLHNLQMTNIDIYDNICGPNIENNKGSTKSENLNFKVEIDNCNILEENSNNNDFVTDFIDDELPLTKIKQELSDSEKNANMMKHMKIEEEQKNKRLNRRRNTKSSSKDGQHIKTKAKSRKSLEDDKSDILMSVCEGATTMCEGATSSFTQYMQVDNLRFTCDYCGRMFQWKCILKRHIELAHVDDQLQCAHCAKVFKNKRGLRGHVKYFHERRGVTDSAPVQCPICLKMFKMKKTFHVHLKRMHTPNIGGKDEERYCVECNKLFKSKIHYEVHLKTSVKHAADKYECHDCGKKFTLRGNLVQHIKLMHLKKKNHTCSVCGKLFFKGYRCRLHEQHEHFGVPRARNHACGVCGKAFTTAPALRRHVRIHSGAKPYQCAHCPSKFTQSSTLRTHCKFKHKDLIQMAKTN